MKIFATIILALLLHLLLGWQWTLAAGIVGGYWAGRRGWMVGLLGVGLSWLALIVYNFIAAGPAVREMTDVLGEILGGMPGFVVLALTWVIGLLLGTVGGLIGTQARYMMDSDQQKSAVA